MLEKCYPFNEKMQQIEQLMTTYVQTCLSEEGRCARTRTHTHKLWNCAQEVFLLQDGFRLKSRLAYILHFTVFTFVQWQTFTVLLPFPACTQRCLGMAEIRVPSGSKNEMEEKKKGMG